MFNPKRLINFATKSQTCIWIKVTLLKETHKALLIEFNGKQAWLPKAWILRIKRKHPNRTINIKIFLGHWDKVI